MRLTPLALLFAAALALPAAAEEITLYSGRHYDGDLQLYQGFEAATGIKVNVTEGKADEIVMPLPVGFSGAVGVAVAPCMARAEAVSQKIGAIDIKGYERIEASTILSYFGLREGDSVSSYEIDKAVKALFATGFFADVSVDMSPDGIMTLRVLENPMVNRVVFEGNKYFEDDDLEKEIQLRPRSIYTRPRIQSDVSRLLEIYRRSGRFSAKITPKVCTGRRRLKVSQGMSRFRPGQASSAAALLPALRTYRSAGSTWSSQSATPPRKLVTITVSATASARLATTPDTAMVALLRSWRARCTASSSRALRGGWVQRSSRPSIAGTQAMPPSSRQATAT